MPDPSFPQADCNIFALRSTDPKVLYDTTAIVGADNAEVIAGAARRADVIILAWGTHGELRDQGRQTFKLIRETVPEKPVYCLGATKGGQPKHPLYLAKKQPLQEYVAP